MDCALTKGKNGGCRGGFPGAKAAYFMNYDPDLTLTVDAGGIVTGFSKDITVYRYEFFAGAANFKDGTIASIENQSVYYDQMFGMKNYGLSAVDRAEFLLMDKARLLIFILDYQGNIRIMGYKVGAYVTGGADDGGVNAGDFVGYDRTFLAKEPESMPYLDPYTAVPFDNFVTPGGAVTVVTPA